MEILTNSYDKEIKFDNLAAAKAYYVSDAPAEDEYIGDDFEAYLKDFNDRQEQIRNANTLQELADALNFMSDIFGNGSKWEVKVG